MEREQPMNIPISKTILTKDEYEAIQKPLETGWVVQGPYVKEFERSWSEFTGAKHSIAVTSCTTALHLSLAALGLEKEDEVIVPAFTWISTANVVEHLGAKVVFCDIDLKTFNISVSQIESKITPKTKAIIPVHLFGLSADMDQINTIAKRYGLWVVEDAACGFGSKFNGRHVGNFGDTGCFSFHPRKAITTGEGGMVTTNDDKLAEKMRSMRDHGAAMSDFQRHHGARPYLLSEHPYAGYNYRMTDIQATLGTTQMKRANNILTERKSIADFYDSKFSDLYFFQLPFTNESYSHGYQSYPCIYDVKNLNLNNIGKVNKARNMFMDKLQKNGISTRPATHAVHMLEYYSKKYKIKKNQFPNAFLANECSISFPLFNGLKINEMEYVVETVRKLLKSL